MKLETNLANIASHPVTASRTPANISPSYGQKLNKLFRFDLGTNNKRSLRRTARDGSKARNIPGKKVTLNIPVPINRRNHKKATVKLSDDATD